MNRTSVTSGDARIRCRSGRVKNTLDHHDGDVITKTGVATEIGCAVNNTVHELLRGSGRAASHEIRQALAAKFLSKAVLRLGHAIRIQDQYIT